MILQLNPPLPLETTKGAGWAHFVIDYGPEGALPWVVFMDSDGTCWTGRRKPEDLRPPSKQEGSAAHTPQPLRPSLVTVADR